MTREKIKELWKLCFNDDEEFVELYFNQRYNNGVNVAIESGEEVIAALQMLPYSLTFGAQKLSTAYISGACTHPDFRNRGVMLELLSQAFSKMLHNNVAISTLIPAEPWLFSYYARIGYAPLFKYSQNTFVASAMFSPHTDLLLKKTDEYEEEVYEYLNRKLTERTCCIQHTATDFHIILSDLRLSQGYIFTLNNAEVITALAIAYPEDNGNWHIGEIVSDTPDRSSLLLQQICEDLNICTIQVYTSPIAGQSIHTLGMARIINAKTMLQLYATAHPEVEMNIILTDEQIDANNGYFYLNNGKCMSNKNRLSGSHLSLTIGELAETIFADSHPYMSLMLN